MGLKFLCVGAIFSAGPGGGVIPHCHPFKSMPISVSIVEDDLDLKESIEQFISSSTGFRCLSTHAHADEALARIPSASPDVVLMDINLGGMSGIECTRRLKEVVPGVQILMLTVFEDSEKIFQALAAGASGYLLKRVAPSKLLDAIREVHAGGSPMSGPIARKVVQSFHLSPTTSKEGDALSPRERQVLDLLAKGYAYKQISDQLELSIDTIRTYIRRIYDKLHVHSRTEAVARYLGSPG